MIKKKIAIYLIVLILLLVNCIFINNSQVEATVEEGLLKLAEAPYNIKIINTAHRSSPDITYMIDEKGKLWQTTNTGLKQLFSTKFSQIECGYNHVIAIDNEGYLWGWGDNSFYQLGNGGTDYTDTPVEILPTQKFKAIACSLYASFAIDEEGYLYAWGDNYWGETQKYNHTESSKLIPDVNINGYNNYAYNTLYFQTYPQKILTSNKFQKICAYGNTIMALDEEGYAWGWGMNSSGEIGDYSSNIDVTYKYERIQNSNYTRAYGCIKEAKKINTKEYKDISLGFQHSILLDTDGKVYTQGSSLYGALGNGKTTYGRYGLVCPIGLENIKIVDILAGAFISAFIDENNNLWMCGQNSNGELGNASTSNSATIVKTKKNIDFIGFTSNNMKGYSKMYFTGEPSSSYDYGEYSSMFVFDKNGDLWGWGSNKNYSLGVETEDSSIPIQITAVKTTHKVTFKNGAQTIKEDIVEDGTAATAPEITKPGYTLTWDTDFSNVTEDLIVTAIWTANANTPYTIEHYLRSLDKEVESYELIEREPKTGTTDSLAVAVPKTYTGFTENKTYSERVPNGTITADGNLVLKVYYNRNTYNIEYQLNGGTPTTQLISNYTYGEEMILQNRVTKEGYVFAGWYDNEALSGTPITKIGAEETEDKTFYAKWATNIYNVTFKDDEDGKEETKQVAGGNPVTPPNWTKPGYEATWDGDLDNITEDTVIKVIWVPKTNTPYTVEYYLRSTDSEVETYTLKEAVPLTGTTGQTVNAEIKEYTGFTENTNYAERKVTGTILADGSLTLKVYYKRNQYEVTLNTNGGRVTSGNINSYTYGIEEVLPTRVTKNGYIFVGWYDNAELSGNPITKIGAGETEAKTYYAKWATEDEYYITSEVYSLDFEHNYITKVSPNTTITTFMNNITTNGTKKVVNAKGEDVNTEALVGTGYKLQVTYKGIVHEYEIAVRGDVDGNGEVTVTDLSMVNQSIVQSLTLTGVKKIAADTDYNGEITVTDLSMVNQAITGKTKL